MSAVNWKVSPISQPSNKLAQSSKSEGHNGKSNRQQMQINYAEFIKSLSNN
jgi:hypothetical protein